jgi:hypothetical protein
MGKPGFVQKLKLGNGLEPGAVATGCRCTSNSQILSFSITEKADNYPVATAPGSDPLFATFLCDFLCKADKA